MKSGRALCGSRLRLAVAIPEETIPGTILAAILVTIPVAIRNLTRNLHEHGVVGIMTGYEEKFHALGTPINRCEVVMKPFVLPPEEKKKAEEEA